MQPVKVEKNHPVLFGVTIAAGIVVFFVIIFLIVTALTGGQPDIKNSNASQSLSSSSVSSSSKASSSSSSNAADIWDSLALNQQIALLIQQAVSQAELAGQFGTMSTAKSYSMTGTISNGTILMNSDTDSATLALVTISDKYVTIENKFLGKTTTVTLEKLIQQYFTSQDQKDTTNSFAQRIVAPIVKKTSSMNLAEIQQGNYESIQGTWKSKDGFSYIVTNSSVTMSSANSSQSTKFIYGSPIGDTRSPWYISAWGKDGKVQNGILILNIPDAYMAMAPKGTNLRDSISPANQVLENDAIWTGQGTPGISHLAYKVN